MSASAQLSSFSTGRGTRSPCSYQGMADGYGAASAMVAASAMRADGYDSSAFLVDEELAEGKKKDTIVSTNTAFGLHTHTPTHTTLYLH